MHTARLAAWMLLSLGAGAPLARGQQPAPAPANPSNALEAIAVTVNGQPIREIAVQRGLRRLPADKQNQARAEIVDFLIDTTLVDQYLGQLHVDVDPQEVGGRLQEVKDEIRKSGEPLDKVFEELLLTEDELRSQLASELRWEKFCERQISEKDLRDVFSRSPEMFDGSTVRARHILLTPPPADTQAAAQAKIKLLRIRQQIEDQVASGLTSLPANTDYATREKRRNYLTETTFAEAATKESACPSRSQGGDLGWFPRTGAMVEPFAQAAFALRPFQMSDVIQTQFGCHLILTTERRPGHPTRFEDIKEIVKEVYCERLREALIAQLRPNAKIVIAGQARP
jgi:parvulin-like peptidyl-prolyl isomerase